MTILVNLHKDVYSSGRKHMFHQLAQRSTYILLVENIFKYSSVRKTIIVNLQKHILKNTCIEVYILHLDTIFKCRNTNFQSIPCLRRNYIVLLVKILFNCEILTFRSSYKNTGNTALVELRTDSNDFESFKLRPRLCSADVRTYVTEIPSWPVAATTRKPITKYRVVRHPSVFTCNDVTDKNCL